MKKCKGVGEGVAAGGTGCWLVLRELVKNANFRHF